MGWQLQRERESILRVSGRGGAEPSAEAETGGERGVGVGGQFMWSEECRETERRRGRESTRVESEGCGGGG